MNKEKYIHLVGGVIIIFILIMSFYSYGLYDKNRQLEQELETYKTLLIADLDLYSANQDKVKADTYYDEASFFYENQNFKLVESNCRLAREYYSRAANGFVNIKSDLDRDNELIDKSAECIDLRVKLTWELFEACEYFESASRYYHTYYNTNVPYDDPSYDMGTSQINRMNENIRNHDRLVLEYNDCLGDFNTKLKRTL